MRGMRTALPLTALLLVLAARPAPAAAAEVEVHAGFKIPLPEVPRLVVIQPGVKVVQDFDDEVFIHEDVYWARRGDRWYRAPDRHAKFVVVETRLVPEPLRRLPPGRYRHYRPPPPPPARFQRVLTVEERKLDKKEEKRRRKEEDKERKEREHEHGHDHHGGKER